MHNRAFYTEWIPKLLATTGAPAVVLLLVSLLAGFANAIQAAEVTATKLDGSTLTGELRSWNGDQVVIVAPAGEEQIAAEKLLSLRWSRPSTAPVETAAYAELTDGTAIPMASLRVSDKTATLMFDPLQGTKDKSIELPVAQLAAVRFQKLDPAIAGQWDEIRRQNATSDLLVVLKRDGKSLDYVEGVLGNITEQQVEFKLDGDMNRVDRAKVAGIVYYRANSRPAGEPHMVLQGRSGLRASVAKIAFADPTTITVSTVDGLKFNWPVDDIDLADFSSGKLKYLSDIEPASQNWSPLVGLPTGATAAAEYGQPHRDHSAFGGKLSLLMTDKSTDAATLPGVVRVYPKGLALRSRTELIYRLPAGFNRLNAVAGIDPAASTSGNVRLTILADDRPLIETELAHSEPSQPIDVEITGAKRLKIIVDFGRNLNTGDWVNLCDAKIVK